MWLRAAALHGRGIEHDRRGHRRRAIGVNGFMRDGVNALGKVGTARRLDSSVGGVSGEQMAMRGHLAHCQRRRFRARLLAKIVIERPDPCPNPTAARPRKSGRAKLLKASPP
jgi:hypothetical protein